MFGQLEKRFSSLMPTSTQDTSSTTIDSRFQAQQPSVRLQARLASRQAVFRYQRQVDLQTGRIAGVEAVLCVPGDNGFRAGVELRAEVEAAGLGLALLERQLRKVCREKVKWLQSFPHDFPVAVQVPSGVIGNAQLLQMVLQILAEYQLAPSFLELEIGQSACAAGGNALRSLSGFRDAGISIAIEGFNAAHSNLRFLALLPASKLKVDALPLLRQQDDVTEKRVFDAIVAVARGLGMLICATNVNSAAVLAAVLRQARPLAQGMELGDTLDAASFLQCLHDRNETTATLPLLTAGREATSAESDRMTATAAPSEESLRLA